MDITGHNLWGAIISAILTLQTGVQLFWIRTIFLHETRLTRLETGCEVRHEMSRRSGDK